MSNLIRLPRRRLLSGLGVLGASRYLPACSSSNGVLDEGGCARTPAQTEGPFFVDTGLVRNDIRDGKAGAQLGLALSVVEAGSCAPISGALIEVWHADAAGAYSAFDTSQGNSANTAGETFLRGFQSTSDEGRADFVTIYPGWYPGRTPHIHLMVRIGQARLLTTQLYFPEDVTDTVYALPPYAARGPRSTTNASDNVGGISALLSDVTADGEAYTATFRLAVPPV